MRIPRLTQVQGYNGVMTRPEAWTKHMWAFSPYEVTWVNQHQIGPMMKIQWPDLRVRTDMLLWRLYDSEGYGISGFNARVAYLYDQSMWEACNDQVSKNPKWWTI